MNQYRVTRAGRPPTFIGQFVLIGWTASLRRFVASSAPSVTREHTHVD